MIEFNVRVLQMNLTIIRASIFPRRFATPWDFFIPLKTHPLKQDYHENISC